jgi:hypothetical protein
LQILSVILQITDAHNYSLLSHLITHTPSITHDSLETIFRLLEAQPYLLKVWNCSGLFDISLQQETSPQTRYLLQYLRLMAAPGNQALARDVETLKTIGNIEYMDGLRLNKAEERDKESYFQKLFGTLQVRR